MKKVKTTRIHRRVRSRSKNKTRAELTQQRVAKQEATSRAQRSQLKKLLKQFQGQHEEEHHHDEESPDDHEAHHHHQDEGQEASDSTSPAPSKSTEV